MQWHRGRYKFNDRVDHKTWLRRPSPSLRAQRSSALRSGAIEMDRFVASAPRNEVVGGVIQFKQQIRVRTRRVDLSQPPLPTPHRLEPQIDFSPIRRRQLAERGFAC